MKPIWRAKLRAPFALTLVIALTGFAATSPLRGIGGGTPVSATLRLSALYIVLAPWCDFLDSLTLLSVRQHIAFVSTLLAGYALWRTVRWNGTRALFHELVGIGIFTVVLVGIYSAGALLPRPMASLHVLNPDALAVDFHSHTRASWDGRRSFSSENNRSWHRDAGFDAVYISDHGTLSGVIEGEARNPKLSGDGTVILPAVEVRCDGHHVIILGATIQEGTPDCASAVVPASSSGAAAHAWNAAGMITLLTIPARFALDRPIPRSQAIEIADAAPRAFDQMERDGPMLRRIARDDDLAVVASSNNHGWGRTAAAWSILDIPHWRKLSPAQLDAAIRRRLAVLRGKSVYVVERRRVTPPSSALAFLATAPSVAWQLLTILSPRERVSWIVWIWILWSLSLSVRHQIRIRRLRSSPLDALLR